MNDFSALETNRTDEPGGLGVPDEPGTPGEPGEPEALGCPAGAPWPPARYRLTLAPSPHIARHVRRVVRVLLRVWRLACLADAAELAVTELLANVVRHAPDGPCRVDIARRPDGVRVEVRDGSPRLPTPRAAGELDEDGRGLPLLSLVTDVWDARRDPEGGGKVVWFEITAGADRVSSCGRAENPAHRPRTVEL